MERREQMGRMARRRRWVIKVNQLFPEGHYFRTGTRLRFTSGMRSRRSSLIEGDGPGLFFRMNLLTSIPTGSWCFLLNAKARRRRDAKGRFNRRYATWIWVGFNHGMNPMATVRNRYAIREWYATEAWWEMDGVLFRPCGTLIGAG